MSATAKDDAIETLGRDYLAGEAKRDAVHVAVAPVVPNEDMQPGTKVVFLKSGDTVNVRKAEKDELPVGVIDPFKLNRAMKGWHCWMLLMPRSIVGLRHEWQHPAFNGTTEDQSEAWLRALAAKYEYTYEKLVSEAVSGDGSFFGTDIDYEDFFADADFWHHIETVSGEKLSKQHRENASYRCAC